ncbi:hypothetical protein JOY44_02245 [Phormidium sp. CLA17]|uniref:hypothetical protein n=1 Tax=Leptolyngbya sp. Cla-17 TaxID=2803751 RepID=UPI0014921A32|nr:hypothetical protein [Leptolyngbya sp. Cla-17]MBM0740446.1 hypothetical protein [Leptolyngbya sp. Cla-17]
MVTQKVFYEEALAEYSDATAAIALLRQYRPYLEMIPSMRRPDESLITIPLPIIRLRGERAIASSSGGISVGQAKETLCLPCDVAILMCDPEWKIKTGVEIFLYIHRPEEDFSDLLGRWRYTQVHLSRGYEWDMPSRYRHILSEGADSTYPLFVIFEGTPERIKRGLKGAYLPFVTRRDPDEAIAEDVVELSEAEALWMDDQDTLRD